MIHLTKTALRALLPENNQVDVFFHCSGV